MKKLTVGLLCLLYLTGCSGDSDEIDVAMALRTQILQAEKCTFDADITADYGEKLQHFTLRCEGNADGDISFTVIVPESIAGISGNLCGEGGYLSFDKAALHFELLADNQLSPISAPWILLKTLRSGYLTSACTEDDRIRLSIDDSYEENPLRLDILLDKQNMPVQADILYNGRRILSVTVKNFEIL